MPNHAVQSCRIPFLGCEEKDLGPQGRPLLERVHRVATAFDRKFTGHLRLAVSFPVLVLLFDSLASAQVNVLTAHTISHGPVRI
jgi:hypothetical protein